MLSATIPILWSFFQYICFAGKCTTDIYRQIPRNRLISASKMGGVLPERDKCTLFVSMVISLIVSAPNSFMKRSTPQETPSRPETEKKHRS
jgi:hypothetical protein